MIANTTAAKAVPIAKLIQRPSTPRLNGKASNRDKGNLDCRHNELFMPLQGSNAGDGRRA